MPRTLPRAAPALAAALLAACVPADFSFDAPDGGEGGPPAADGGLGEGGARFDAAGDAAVDAGPTEARVAWRRAFGAGECDLYALAAAGGGAVHVGGAFRGVVDFGLGAATSPSAGATALFLARVEADGRTTWANAWGTSDEAGGGSGEIDAVAEMPSGELVAAGTMSGTLDLGTGAPLVSSGGTAALVAFFSLAGGGATPAAAVALGNAGSNGARAVAIDGGGRAVVAGSFEGTIDFGGGGRAASGHDVFVTTYDAQHAWVSAATFGGAGDEHAYGLAVDAAHGLEALAGDFRGATDFGGKTAQANGVDAFVAGVSTGGAVRWLRTAGGAGTDQALAVAVDAAGAVYATGDFAASVDFGHGALATAGGSDGFVAAFDGDGNPTWAVGFGGTDDDAGAEVAVDPASGDVLVAGTMGGAGAIAGAPLPGGAFVARFTHAGALVAATPLRSAGSRALALAALAAGAAVVGGRLTAPLAGGADGGPALTGTAFLVELDR